jgi:hypothetical protein
MKNKPKKLPSHALDKDCKQKKRKENENNVI